jgi:hypothetical protein
MLAMETENLENLSKAYIAAFQVEGLPRRMAEDCAQILINDRTRDRTPAEQETIRRAWEISQGLDERDMAA